MEDQLSESYKNMNLIGKNKRITVGRQGQIGGIFGINFSKEELEKMLIMTLFQKVDYI